MNILVTGGTGFVGSQLVRQLTQLQHHCTILTRTPRTSQDARIHYVSWDTANTSTLTELMNTHDAVINLAGETVGGGRWTKQRKRAIRESRLNITKDITTAIANAATPPATLINASAIGWYASSQDIQNETSPAGSSFLSQMVQDWEAQADSASAYCRVVKLRIGLVFGQQGGPLHRLLPIFRYGLGGRIGSGQQWMSWIHRDDLVQMIIAALHDPRWHGSINAVSPTPITNADFTKAIARAVKRPAICHVPAWAMRCLLGEMSDLVLTSHRIQSTHPALDAFPYQNPHIANAITASL